MPVALAPFPVARVKLRCKKAGAGRGGDLHGGVITGVAGGMIRDVLIGEIPLSVFQYATFYLYRDGFPLPGRPTSMRC